MLRKNFISFTEIIQSVSRSKYYTIEDYIFTFSLSFHLRELGGR